jgi:hypothetical protein
LSKINWDRPELKILDNTKKYFKDLSALYNYQGPQQSITWNIGQKGKLIIKKIDESELLDYEKAVLNEFFNIITIYNEFILKQLSSTLIENKKDRKSAKQYIKKEIEENYQKLVYISEELLISEAYHRIHGRRKGISWVLNFLKPSRQQNSDNYSDSLHYCNIIIEALNDASANIENKGLINILSQKN